MGELTYKGLIAVILLFCIAGCSNGFCSGTTLTGFNHFPPNKISPKQALEKAEKYILLSYELRIKNRAAKYNSTEKVPIVYVVLHRNYYYVTKDNYDSKNVKFYLDYAVKVNKNTGEIISPTKE